MEFKPLTTVTACNLLCQHDHNNHEKFTTTYVYSKIVSIILSKDLTVLIQNSGFCRFTLLLIVIILATVKY